MMGKKTKSQLFYDPRSCKLMAYSPWVKRLLAGSAGPRHPNADELHGTFFVKHARIMLAGLGATVAVLVLAAVALWSAVPKPEALARDIEAKLTHALGVQVTVQAVHWQLLPVPEVIIDGVATGQTPPVTIQKLTLHPKVSMLWQRRLSFDLAELDGAVVPQLSLRALGRSSAGDGSAEVKSGAPSVALPAGFVIASVPLDRFTFRNVTWITRRGIPVVYDGDVDFDAGWRPRTAQLRRPDFKPLTDAVLTRIDQQDRWGVSINLGGGTANGDVQLTTASSGALRLDGKLKPQAVEVASALAAFSRRPVIAGKASGNTTLSASGTHFSDLVQSLQTQTTFTLKPATLLRFDLNKAVRTAGKDHAGQTPLDTVSGSMDTQNTPQGMVVSFKNIKARSGLLSASGDAVLANQQIKAELAVDLVDGIVGVPLLISGPTNAVSVTLPAGAVAGAAVGTALLPGPGTAVGARLGAAIGKFFGSAPPADGKTAPRPAPRPK